MAHAIAAGTTGAMAFRPETRRGGEGFFHAVQESGGQWWLVDPAGKPVWIKAVHGVRSAHAHGERLPPRDSAARLRTWNFDTVGVGSDGTGWEDGFAVLAQVDFCTAGPVVTAPGLRLPDVFDPQWPAVAAQYALRMCLPLADNPNVIGWVTDDAPGWAQPMPAHPAPGVPAAPGRPSLLQLCLSLEPSFAAYHAAWEFVLAHHGGRLEALARSWGVELANKEVVRELSRAEKGIATRGYLRDEVRWTREFARRYFTTTAAAIRAADPNHLVLGCRFGGVVGAAVLAESVYPAVDVAMPDWRELPPHSATAAANGKESAAANPVLAGDVCWATPEFLKLPTAARLLRLTSVEWMLRRARTALERTARHPATVGYAWRQWQDEPGEQPPFARGLVHVDGAEAREHTELLAEFNSRAESVRRAALKSASS